jgi:hypothetical protein
MWGRWSPLHYDAAGAASSVTSLSPGVETTLFCGVITAAPPDLTCHGTHPGCRDTCARITIPLYIRPEILILVLFFIRTSWLITRTRGPTWSIASNQDYSQLSRSSRWHDESANVTENFANLRWGEAGLTNWRLIWKVWRGIPRTLYHSMTLLCFHLLENAQQDWVWGQWGRRPSTW